MVLLTCCLSYSPSRKHFAQLLPGLLITDIVKVAVKVVTFNHRHGKSCSKSCLLYPSTASPCRLHPVPLGAPPGDFLANFLPGLLVTDMVKVAVKVVTFNHRHGKSRGKSWATGAAPLLHSRWFSQLLPGLLITDIVKVAVKVACFTPPLLHHVGCILFLLVPLQGTSWLIFYLDF